jgi:hypothetical protein
MTSGSQQPAQVPWYSRWVRGMALAAAPGVLFALPGALAASLDGWLQSTRPEWAGAGRAAIAVFWVAWLVVVPLIIYRGFTDLAKRWQGPG